MAAIYPNLQPVVLFPVPPDAASLEPMVFILNILKYLLPPVLVHPPVLLLLSLILAQYVSLLPGACG